MRHRPRRPPGPSRHSRPRPPRTAENDSRSEPEDTREAAPNPTELERIVGAWSEAPNTEDNEAAAGLFAPDALIVQGGIGILLNGRAGAVRFNSSLPCSGLIVQLETELNSVIAVFELSDRPSNACDAPPGTLAAARFVIEDGLITVWQQLPVPGKVLAVIRRQAARSPSRRTLDNPAELCGPGPAWRLRRPE